MLKRILDRLYQIERRLLQIDPKILYTVMSEKYTKKELSVGVLFEDFTIRWSTELHRFTPIDFTNLPYGKFERLEEEIYYLVIAGASINECLLAYYDVELEEEVTLLPLHHANKQVVQEYMRSNR